MLLRQLLKLHGASLAAAGSRSNIHTTCCEVEGTSMQRILVVHHCTLLSPLQNPACHQPKTARTSSPCFINITPTIHQEGNNTPGHKLCTTRHASRTHPCLPCAHIHRLFIQATRVLTVTFICHWLCWCCCCGGCCPEPDGCMYGCTGQRGA